MSTTDDVPVDLKQRLLDGYRSVHRPAETGPEGGVTGLSTDEVVLLDSIDWEPVALVCGACTVGFRIGTWSPLGAGNTSHPSKSLTEALARSVLRLERACAEVGGLGVVAVTTDIDVKEHYASVQLMGTAVRMHRGRHPDTAFSSNMSAKEFVLLHRGGWSPVSMAFGACFVRVARRSVSETLWQQTLNIELSNFTQALTQARVNAMNGLRETGGRLAGDGVVQISLSDGRLPFAQHVISFVACGTVIRSSDLGRIDLHPTLAVDLRDPMSHFEATSLRGTRADKPMDSDVGHSEWQWGHSIRSRLRSNARRTKYEM